VTYLPEIEAGLMKIKHLELKQDAGLSCNNACYLSGKTSFTTGPSVETGPSFSGNPACIDKVFFSLIQLPFNRDFFITSATIYAVLFSFIQLLFIHNSFDHSSF